MQLKPYLTFPFPDYESEADWLDIVALFPEEDRANAPSYAEIKQMLDALEAGFAAQGLGTRRVKVKPLTWERWVVSEGRTLGKPALVAYANSKLDEDSAG